MEAVEPIFKWVNIHNNNVGGAAFKIAFERPGNVAIARLRNPETHIQKILIESYPYFGGELGIGRIEGKNLVKIGNNLGRLPAGFAQITV